MPELLEAILLVGGQGTRLRPLTIGTPKPLLPTAGVPFLAHQFAKAAASGVTHVVLATAYRASMFAECFGDGAAFGLRISYVHEAEPLGTGGAIRNAASGLRCGPDSPVVVLNGDILSGHDISAQVDLHRKSDAAVTLHLVEVPDPARFGCVPTDPEGRVTAASHLRCRSIWAGMSCPDSTSPFSTTTGLSGPPRRPAAAFRMAPPVPSGSASCT